MASVTDRCTANAESITGKERIRKRRKMEVCPKNACAVKEDPENEAEKAPIRNPVKKYSERRMVFLLRKLPEESG